MGRQIQVAMDPGDEDRFLGFLRQTTDLRIFRSWSPHPADVNRFDLDIEAAPFYLENCKFPWEARFDRVDYVDRITGRPSFYFRVLDRHAPLMEYSRHPLAAENPQVSGRLYWAKMFVSQPEDITYDIAGFDLWFSAVTRWIRKNGTKVRHGTTEPWCLPGAAKRLATP